jgi:multimeric flavodoxin WrbA
VKTLLIVFHSLTGGTRQMADAAARGANAQGEVHVHLLPAVEAQPADVLAADGYIFIKPENLAAISGLMKDFFDRTYYAALGRIKAGPARRALRRPPAAPVFGFVGWRRRRARSDVQRCSRPPVEDSVPLQDRPAAGRLLAAATR